MKKAFRVVLLAVLMLTAAQSIAADPQGNFEDPPPESCTIRVCQ